MHPLSILPQYAGPQVTIRLMPSGRIYRLSKNMICSQSDYFKAMFEGDFQEGVSQTATMDEMEGAVSVSSFELLVQWLYIGRVTFKETSEEKKISSVIEFARIADMCRVTGMESSMAEQIRVIIKDAKNITSNADWRRDPGLNTRWIGSKHIKWASSLPRLHPIRRVLAEAAVEGYFRSEGVHKFHTETREVPEFAADLLDAVRDVLKRLKEYGHLTFMDPITKKELPFSQSL